LVSLSKEGSKPREKKRKKLRKGKCVGGKGRGGGRAFLGPEKTALNLFGKKEN